MTETEIWNHIEKEALEFLGPRSEKISPIVYYQAVTDLIRHTLKLRALVVDPEPFDLTPKVDLIDHETNF